jgi:hypothetical protein
MTNPKHGGRISEDKAGESPGKTKTNAEGGIQMNYKYNPAHGGGYGPSKFDRGCDVPHGRFSESGRFGRMLPHLRSLKSFKPGPDALGKLGGPMDAGAAGAANPDNPRIRAGYTFLGQFIDHDLTLDATSNLEQQIDPHATRNFRTPALELDNVYGLGPKVQPYLYEKNNAGRMLLGPGGFDVPRNSEGIALIGDPRNDENIVVSQLHLLMLKFHNKVFDEKTNKNAGVQERFEEAQKIVRWHYQWIVINEFLARTVGQQTIDRALEHVPFKFSEERGAFMPVEFSVAAYRFGHSQVRPFYGINDGNGAPLFPADPAAPEDNDLRGRRPVPENLRVDWKLFFGPEDVAQESKLIDTRISTPLLLLPNTVIDPNTAAVGSPDERLRSLASRNLQRGIDARLPSGQDVAKAFKVKKLSDEEVWANVPEGEGPAPLWFYCLREAEVLGEGLLLAGAGAQIVARTFAAILEADKASFIAQEPDWKPTLGPVEGKFTVSDLVNFTLGTNLGQEDLAALKEPAE